MSLLLGLWLAVLCSVRGSQVEEIGDLADDLSSEFLKIFNRSTAYNSLIAIYTEVAQSAEIVTVNGSTTAEQILTEARNNEAMITSTLQATVVDVEELYSSNIVRCCSKQCDRSSTEFDNIACYTQCNHSEVSESFFRAAGDPAISRLPNLTYHPSFNYSVNLNHSTIFIPVNIYEKDTSILCFVEWTRSLTDRFLTNWYQLMEQHVSLIYIGDQSGAMLTYPAFNWGGPDGCEQCPYRGVDTFDPRDRPWYIDTVYGEKYVVILIDQSGSMTGSSSTRARLSIIELINDLDENDFFLILRVDSSTSNLITILRDDGLNEEFVRASAENKLDITKTISEMPPPRGAADFTDSLNMAYKYLMGSSACHKLILIFSDGRASFPVNKFTEMNAGGEVSVFSFLVDPLGQEKDLKTLACDNKGTFTYMSTFDHIDLSVQVLTQELLRRFSKINTTFSHQYTDFNSNSLVLTFSIPVQPSVDNETRFTGVLAVDVTEDIFKQVIEKHELGSLGYAFFVDNNGQLFGHPLMRSEVLEYSRNLLVFHFTQYEFLLVENSSLLLDSIVTRDTGQREEEPSYISVEHKKRYILANSTYYYRPFDDTLSLVLKLPSDGVRTLKVLSPLNITLLNEINEMMLQDNQWNDKILIVGMKPFCFGRVWYYLDSDDDAAMEFLTELIKEVTSNGNTSSALCSPTLYEPLLRDLTLVYQVVQNVTMEQGVISTFFKFNSGLLYCILNHHPSFNCSDLLTINYRALAEKNWDRLSVYRGTEGSFLFDTVQLVRPIKIPSAPGVSVGVVGVILDVSFIDDLVFELLNGSNHTLYLVDEGGYVVGSSSNTNYTTSFMGTRQPNLFDLLIDHQIFTKKKITGYHKRLCNSMSGCENDINSRRSSGSRLTGVVMSLVSVVWHFISSLVLVALQSSLLTLVPGYEGQDGNTNGFFTQENINLCLSEITFYMLNDAVLFGNATSGNMSSCSNETIKVLNLPDTSVMAVLFKESSCLRDGPEIEIGERETRNISAYSNHSSLNRTCPVVTNYTSSKVCSSVSRGEPHKQLPVISCILTLLYMITL